MVRLNTGVVRDDPNYSCNSGNTGRSIYLDGGCCGGTGDPRNGRVAWSRIE